jgi:hypothetical protein
MTVLRKLSNEELADLPENWENAKVDTRKYFQCVMEAWEIEKDAYEANKIDGFLVQEYKGRYYTGR